MPDFQLLCCQDGHLAEVSCDDFSGGEDKMPKAFEAAKSLGWPGIKVCEGETAVLPRPKVAWQCPILPLLWTGTPFELLREAPTATELRKAVGAIIGKSVKPNLYKTQGLLASKLEKIGQNQEELSSKGGLVTWPKQKEPERETGRYISDKRTRQGQHTADTGSFN